MQNVAVLYHPHRRQALSESEWLVGQLLERGMQVEMGDGWQPSVVEQICCERDLIVVYGGDGTIIRIARFASRIGVPVLGVNLGRVGFLADVTPAVLRERIEDLADEKYWIESRMMLDVRAMIAGKEEHMLSLNEVAVARGPVPHAISVETSLNGVPFMAFTADAVLIATATGSTAYSLAAGGPILYPESNDFMLTPVAPHLHIGRSVIVPGDTTVALALASEWPGVISVDGAETHDLHPKDTVEVRRSSSVARFAHLRPGDYFYRGISEHLK